MSISTVPTATANLITAISAQPAAKSVDNFVFGIHRGEPVHDWAVDDGVYIAQANRTIARNEMTGNALGALREDYTLIVEIACFRGGDNSDVVADVETRAWALVNAVETAVRSDRTLAGAVPEAWQESSTFISEWDPENTGRRARVTINVHCWAFI